MKNGPIAFNQETLTMDKQTYQRLKKAYERAKKAKREQFTFIHKEKEYEFLTVFAKYFLQYVEFRLERNQDYPKGEMNGTK